MTNLKPTILKKLGQLLWLTITVFILSLVAGTTIHIFAAFTEPSTAPSASDQDFAENILGANNADNDYSSDLVTASGTGSIIERLEYIKDNFSLNFPEQKYQVYDDWNCANNNEGGSSACGAGDAEYTGEEGVWASSTDTDISTQYIVSGIVKKDLRTGLYWSDAFDETQGGNGTEDDIENDFCLLDNSASPCSGTCSGAGGGGCSDAQINNGECDGSKFSCYDADGGTGVNWSALDWCLNLELDADGDGINETDWRLPTQKELMAAYVNGAANNLPNPDHYYWSSTEYYNLVSSAWSVVLYFGGTFISSKTSTGYYARCVRR